MARSDAVGKEPTIDEINAGEVASFKGFSTKDGAVSDGVQTTEEAEVWGARAAANGKAPAKAAPAAAAPAAAETPEQVAEREAAEAEQETPEDKAAREAREIKMTPEQKAAAARQRKLSGGKADKHRSANDRIGQAVAKQRSAERELQLEREARARDRGEFDARLKALETRPLTPDPKAATVVDKDAPQPATYEYGEFDTAYIRDLSHYETRKELAANQVEQDRKAQTTTATAAQAALDQKVQKFGTDGSKYYDDFQKVVIEGAREKAYPLSATIGELLFDSEQGPDIAYYLATNVDIATALAAKSPAAQAKEFGRLEAVFSSTSQDAPVQEDQTDDDGEETPPVRQVQPQPAAATKAPLPLTHRVRAAGGKPTVSGATTDFAAFERLATQQ